MTNSPIATFEDTLHKTVDRYWETIPAVWSSIRGNLRAIVTEDFDISVEQFHILRHIRKGVTSVSELAEVKGISRPAISQAVDLLVERGLISRQQDPGDRRFVNLALTLAGDELLNAGFKKNRAWMEAKMACLDQESLEEINRAMQKLATVFVD